MARKRDPEHLSTVDIRKSNENAVLKALHGEQVASISRLKELTGLSVVTVTRILERLTLTGIVTREERSVTGVGRPAVTFRFNAVHQLLLVVSCYQRYGHYYAGYSVHDLFGECLERREELLSTINTDVLRESIENFLSRYERVAIIGISMPSDSIGGRVGAALRHDPMSERLARHLNGHFNRPVFFETDINAAALGCYKRHPQAGFVTGLVLMPGRAPACGFCYNGAVIRGRDGMAGEVRYFPMFNDVGILPDDPAQADELAVRTLRAVMCVLNPALVCVFTEGLKAGLSERLKRRVLTEVESAMLPRVEVLTSIRDDVVSGMITLCLEKLDRVAA